MNQADLFLAIKDFTHDKVESKGGGFAPVTIDDIHKLSEIIYTIIELKWGRDPDGDLPVKYHLTDWTKYQPMYWSDVPHHHKDMPGHIEAVIDNLRYASEQTRHMFRLIDYFNKDTKAMIEYVAQNHPDYKIRSQADKVLYDFWKEEIKGE